MLGRLDAFQNDLHAHFEKLSSERSQSPYPLFAIEHNRGADEFEDVVCALRWQIEQGAVPDTHWLVWVVYLTEQGYAYAGDEYWRSVEEGIPGWDHTNRHQVLHWFRLFQNRYDAFVPSGSWAEHFNIIAWPITHAILPRFLQGQFIRLLFDVRFDLAALPELTPAAVGRWLNASDLSCSTRLQKFLQQEELSGRLVTAFLADAVAIDEPPIQLNTLNRLIADLDRRRNARRWLDETKRVVKTRYKGLKRTDHTKGSDASNDNDRKSRIDATLMLRQGADNVWSPSIRISGFKSFASTNLDLTRSLRRSQIVINGTTQRRPGAWLLANKREAALPSWPARDRPLLSFEPESATLELILNTAIRLNEPKVWLFQCGRGGIAYERKDQSVIAGNKYFVLMRDPMPNAHGVEVCDIGCKGIYAYELRLPTPVTQPVQDTLHRLGLTLTRMLRVWPAGVPPSSWDDQGHVECLTSHALMIGVATDVECSSLSLQIEGGPPVSYGPLDNSAPSYFQLPNLESGRHYLTVTAQSKTGSPHLSGFLVLDVREPEQWRPGTTLHEGLVARVDPLDATLDELWNGECDIAVFGPEKRSISVEFTLRDAQNATLIAANLGSIRLPIDDNIWRAKFLSLANKHKYELAYLDAAAGEITIDGDDLGRTSLVFERDTPPLRWIVSKRSNTYFARLIDETGSDTTNLQCSLCSMVQPDRPVDCDAVKFGAEIEIPPPGCLLSAHSVAYRDQVIISTGISGSSIADLGLTTSIQQVSSDGASLAKIIKLLSLWSDARLRGPLAHVRQQQVTIDLTKHYFSSLYGKAWVAIEERVETFGTRIIDRLKPLVGSQASFAAAIAAKHGTINQNPIKGLKWFADAAQRYHTCDDPKLCMFALQAASEPHRLSALPDDTLATQLQSLLDSPVIARGARLFAFLWAREQGCENKFPLPRWPW